MVTIDREYLKSNFPEIIAEIQRRHVMEDNIGQELFVNNKPVQGLCHERGYFVILGDMFLQYTMEHIIVDVSEQKVGRRLTGIIVYDDYQEYESDRVRTMSASKDQTGLNLN